MKSIRMVGAALGLAALMAVSAPSAEAAPLVFIQPTPQIVEVGDPVSIDVMISGLTESVGGFDIDVAFDDSILTGDTFAVDPDGNFDSDLDVSFGFSADLVNIALVGDPAGDNLALNPFRLGTINFTAAALGNSLLTLTFNDLSNESGEQLLDASSRGGIVCVVQSVTAPVNCGRQVPEPGLLAMLSIGAAFGFRRFALARPRA